MRPWRPSGFAPSGRCRCDRHEFLFPRIHNHRCSNAQCSAVCTAMMLVLCLECSMYTAVQM